MQLSGIRLQCLQHGGRSVLVSRGRAKGMTRRGRGGRPGAIRSGSAEDLAVSLQPSLEDCSDVPGLSRYPFPGLWYTALILVHIQISEDANAPLPQPPLFLPGYEILQSQAPWTATLRIPGAVYPTHKGENSYLCKSVSDKSIQYSY